MTDLFDSTGRRMTLGKKLGSGGEGAVYETPIFGNDIVAKVYHKEQSAEKQSKLRSMVKEGDESLKKIAAWPLDTLHLPTGGQIRGFLMPKLTGYEPIHHLYGPSHRKQRYPDKDWAFLVNTGRNASAAFDVIHGHGHVIGDVNPNLIFVAENSIVKLIDCDSFQIVRDGTHYLCEVGSPHFTPPELQSHSTFHGIRRTKNHDNFGLALLLFHILMMGRHPFSGVFAGSGDMSLENSIAQFCYAFGRNAASRGMTPPPNSVTPAILPEAVAQLFERALTEQGAQPEGRPTARDWVAALDSLKGQIRTCGQESAHKYFGGLSACPWCIQEQRSGNFFFISLAAATAGISSFNLEQVWNRIIGVQSPGRAPEISLSGLKIQPMPLPKSIKSARNFAVFKKVTAIGLVLGCFFYAPALLAFALIIGAILFFSGADDSTERRVRGDALNAAGQYMDAAKEHWNLGAGDGKFQVKLKELSNLRTEYESLANQLAQEKQKLQQNLRNTQLHKFLDKFFLGDHNIPGIGPTRKATLASFGIETAADVTWNKVMNINGFGQKLTRELIDWRNRLERRFVFDPTKGVDPADIAAVNQRFGQKRKQIEGNLLAGPEQLNQIRGQILQQRSQMLPMIRAASQQVAQAKADLAVLG
jgi:DNA-binding helix-hairpin-helix protein with protein kinase domain